MYRDSTLSSIKSSKNKIVGFCLKSICKDLKSVNKPKRNEFEIVGCQLGSNEIIDLIYIPSWTITVPLKFNLNSSIVFRNRSELPNGIR